MTTPRIGRPPTSTRTDSDSPVRVVVGVAALAAGVALVMAPITAHETAVITGLGFVFTGIALLLRAHPDRSDSASSLRFTRVFGVLVVVAGAVIAILPAFGVTWVAFLIAAGIVAHGLFAVLRAVRSPSQYRIAELIAGLAGVVLGALAFTWPVLTLTIFRFAVGAWFIFVGLRLLFELLIHRVTRQPRRPRDDRAAAGSKPAPWRSRARVFGSSIALLLAVLLAVGSGALLGGAPLPEPGEFYAPPGAVPAEPGKLLRTERLTTGVPNGAQAWKILYTTTRSDGSPAVSSGTVLAPKTLPADPMPLLTVAHGTTGVVPKCAPSLSANPFADGAGAALAEMVTQHGWVAVTSDYIGLGTSGTHPYLVGDAEARNVLDASRAVQEFTPVRTTTKTVVWGHSQGGQAALWTGQIAGDYAPELTIEGVAAFAPAADLYGLAEADKNGAAGKTVSAYIAATWNDLYPKFKLEQHLTPGSAGGVERIEDLCFNGSDVLGAIVSGTQIPNQVFPDSLLAGPFGDELKAQTPLGPWPAPVMVAQGLADPLVKPAMQHDWVASRCTAGEPIDYRTFPGLDHTSLVSAGSPLTPQIVQWTLDRWSGKAATPNCSELPPSTSD